MAAASINILSLNVISCYDSARSCVTNAGRGIVHQRRSHRRASASINDYEQMFALALAHPIQRETAPLQINRCEMIRKWFVAPTVRTRSLIKTRCDRNWKVSRTVSLRFMNRSRESLAETIPRSLKSVRLLFFLCDYKQAAASFTGARARTCFAIKIKFPSLV